MRSEEALLALADERAEQGVPVTRMWKDAIDGFAAVLTPNEVTALQDNPDVLSVDAPEVITLSSTQITPPWGLDRIDQRNQPLSGSYTYTSTGAGVDAYVLDTGIRATHTEFTGRIPRGAYVDFGDGTGVADCDGHGTHVAGTLGGTSYGVAKGVDIIPVKVFDCNGWTMEELVISGLDWIVSDHEAGQPAVLNMSLGGPASNTLDAAVNAAINDGITVVVAAGNEADWTCYYSPARVPGAITVAASEIDDDDADYSNYGQCNDIFAPGTGILSSWISSDTATNTISGTSMASPHVAGAVARYLQGHPTATPATVWTALDAASTKGVLSECCGDPDKLLYVEGSTSVPPSAPQSVQASRGNERAVVWWFAPASNGGLVIEAYRVSSNPDGHECWAYVTPTCTVMGLTNGTSYTFTVSAYNEAGEGPPSEPSNAVVPSGEPGQVREVYGFAAFESVALTWSAPLGIPGVAPPTDYHIEWGPTGFGPWTPVADDVSSATTAVVSGLVNNSTYYFHVAAVNAAGVGEFSRYSGPVYPGTSPGAPENITVAPGPGSIDVSWTAPTSDGGRPITSYIAQAYPSDRAGCSSGPETLRCTIAGLTNGTTYQVRVVAWNGAGTSPQSPWSDPVTPRTTPDMPRISGITGNGSANVVVTWTLPFDGGAPVLDYDLLYSTQPDFDEGAGTFVENGTSVQQSATITGLPLTTNHWFRVRATNSVGDGPWSTAFSDASAPSPPLNVAATPATTGLTVSWSVPQSTGTSPITDYTIEMAVGSGSWSPVTDGISTNTTHDMPSLPNGTYSFRIRAVNANGSSDPSNIASVTLSTPPPPSSAPSPPLNVAATPATTGLTVTWSIPQSTGTSPITDYTIEMSVDGGAWTPVTDDVSTNTTHNMPGLANGFTYSFRVRAVNAIGTSDPSSVASVTLGNPPPPSSAPSPPLNVAATPATTGLTVSWSVPQSTGTSPITDYTIEMSVDGGAWTPVTDDVSTNTTHNMPGLANGFTYSFRVRAVNAIGTSDPSSVASVTLGKPSPPTLTATPQNGKVQLTWTASPPSGAALVDYVIQRSKNGGPWTTVKDGTSTRTSFLVTSLTNGVRYDFRIAATSTFATGGWSALSGATPRTVPGQPRSLTVVSRNTGVTLSWRSPSLTGGAPITDYVVQYSLNGISWTTVADAVSTSTSLTVLGLTNGVTHRFRVRAVNEAGRGLATVTKTSTPHLTAPGVPRTPKVVAGNGHVVVSWLAPLIDGGEPVTDYRIEMSLDGRTWTIVDDGVSAAMSYDVTGLTNGVRYRFRVSAANIAGIGKASSIRSAWPHI